MFEAGQTRGCLEAGIPSHSPIKTMNRKRSAPFHHGGPSPDSFPIISSISAQLVFQEINNPSMGERGTCGMALGAV